jgi:hypothetical protein
MRRKPDCLATAGPARDAQHDGAQASERTAAEVQSDRFLLLPATVEHRPLLPSYETKIDTLLDLHLHC